MRSELEVEDISPLFPPERSCWLAYINGGAKTELIFGVFPIIPHTPPPQIPNNGITTIIGGFTVSATMLAGGGVGAIMGKFRIYYHSRVCLFNVDVLL